MSKRRRDTWEKKTTVGKARTSSYKPARGAGQYSGGAQNARNSANARTSGFLGIEKKFYDTSIGHIDVPVHEDWTSCELDPGTGALNTIPRGDNENSRNGRQCTLLSVFITGCVTRATMHRADWLSPLVVPPTHPGRVQVSLVLDSARHAYDNKYTRLFGLVFLLFYIASLADVADTAVVNNTETGLGGVGDNVERVVYDIGDVFGCTACEVDRKVQLC